MNDKDMHNNVDALLGHLSIEKPSVHVVKKSRRRFYNFILLLAACLSIGFCLVMPVWSDKTGLDIIKDWIGSSNDSSLTPLGDDPPPEPEAYHYWNAPENSLGIQETKTVNWSYFKQLFRNNFQYKLEYRISDTWVENNDYLDVSFDWKDEGYWKINLTFIKPPSSEMDVRFTVGMNKQVLNYVEKTGQYEYWINYTANDTEVYNCFFNWSDLMNISDLIFNHGVTDDLFWFRFRKDDVPANSVTKEYVFDPTFGGHGTATLGVSSKNQISGTSFLCPNSGTADNISAYCSSQFGGTSDPFKFAIYKTSDSSLIGYTEEGTVAGSNQWKTLNIVWGGTLVGSTAYTLVWWGEDTAAQSAHFRYLTTTDGVYDMETYNGFPVTASFSTYSGKNFSIYCSYTAGVANTAPTQSLQKIWNSTTSTEKSLNATSVSLTPTCFNVTIADIDADQMNVTIKTNESGTWTTVNATTSGMTDGTYHGYNTSWVDSYDTKYWISFNVSDDSDWCNETFWFWSYNKTNQRLGDHWFLGGNISSNNQLGNFWFLGNNVSNNNQLGNYWFQGGNISSNNQIANYWFLGGNVSSNNQLGNHWFLGGNVSVKSNQRLGDHWFLGGNTSSNNQLGDYWFLGGNTTARINEQLGDFWFLGGNETGNNQLGDYWFLGGNETALLDIYDEYPSNESNVFGLQPTIRFSLTNPTGDPMNYTIYTGNSTANCTHYLDNISSVNNGTYHYVNYYNATNYTVDYYWRVYADDGTQHVNETFHFTPSMQGGQVISSQGAGISIAAAGMMIGVIALVFAISKRKKRLE